MTVSPGDSPDALVYDLLVVTGPESHSATLLREERRIKDVHELNETLAALETRPLVVVLLTKVLIEGPEESDWGTFFLSVAWARAYIHLMDGCCFIARDPASPSEPQATTQVMLDNGEFTEVPHRNTSRRDDGVAAMRYWVESGEQLPRLDWGPG
jgi:hypothetical protein